MTSILLPSGNSMKRVTSDPSGLVVAADKDWLLSRAVTRPMNVMA